MTVFKGISASFGCGCFDVVCLLTISAVLNLQHPDFAMSIFYSGVTTLTNPTYRNSGASYTVRLLLILGLIVISVELRGILPSTLLKPLRVVCRGLGAGSGMVLENLGRFLKKFTGSKAGVSKRV